MDTPMIDSVKMTSKGQVTIPKHIRDKLNLSAGEKVYITHNGDNVIISHSSEHPALRAMRELQDAMKGKFEAAGLNTDEDIMNLVREVRAEIEGL